MERQQERLCTTLVSRWTARAAATPDGGRGEAVAVTASFVNMQRVYLYLAWDASLETPWAGPAFQERCEMLAAALRTANERLRAREVDPTQMAKDLERIEHDTRDLCSHDWHLSSPNVKDWSSVRAHRVQAYAEIARGKLSIEEERMGHVDKDIDKGM